MPLYLIRHTTPDVSKGICYGQSDIDVGHSFQQEANQVKTYLPHSMDRVYSSPLIRCSKLAHHLFPQTPIHWEPDLMEIHCGYWEMKKWDEIPKEEIDPWMNNFVEALIPGGESYAALFDRVVRRFDQIRASPVSTALITHGGVIRSILSHITQTNLVDSFKAFPLHYGCVLKLHTDENPIRPEILFNEQSPEKEMHKPSSFYPS
jgi:alpha-ribazole phosphatase